MDLASREQFLSANDIKDRTDTVDLPLLGFSVEVRALGASYLDEVESKALEMVSGDEDVSRINGKVANDLKLFHGLVAPALGSLREAEQFRENNGPSARLIIEKINELSAIGGEDIAETAAAFPASEAAEGTDGPGAADFGDDPSGDSESA